MKRASVLSVLSAGLLLTGVSGCAVFADLLNPALGATLGLPLNTGQQIGSVIVRLSNTTNETAEMAILISTNQMDPTVGLENQVSNVGPGEAVNHVFDCPIAAIYPAGITNGVGSNQLNTAAATVVADDGTLTDVMYTGGPVTDGVVFECGDVVEIRLVPSTTTDNTDNTMSAFDIVVEVFKGS